jgi:hypothetical protein
MSLEAMSSTNKYLDRFSIEGFRCWVARPTLRRRADEAAN